MCVNIHGGNVCKLPQIEIEINIEIKYISSILKLLFHW